MSHPELTALVDHLVAVTGLAFCRRQHAEIERKLEKRLVCTGCDDFRQYRAFLQDATRGPLELDALVQDITVGETYFFRHKEVFAALRQHVLPEILKRNRSSRRLRAWSAGCSNGAEPYSLSILLRRELESRTRDFRVSIVGTDINTRFLAEAQAARYVEWAFRGSDLDLRRDCFGSEGEAWTLAPRFREGVAFQYHNLVTDPAPSLVHDVYGFDLILCRNVLIYFDEEIVRRTIQRLRSCLVPGGWLIVGHAENRTDLFDGFERVSVHGATTYRRSEGDVALETPVPAAATPCTTPPRPIQAPAESRGALLDSIERLANRRRFAEALARCEAGLERDPLDRQLGLRYALLLQEVGALERAETYLRGALEAEGRWPQGHYVLGVILLRTDRSREARSAFASAGKLLASSPAAPVPDRSDGLSVEVLAALTKSHLTSLVGP